MWFLENVFYHSASRIYGYIQQHILKDETVENTLFNFGFWPGEIAMEIPLLRQRPP